MSPIKEPHFFSAHLFLPQPYAAPPIADQAAYLALFADAAQQPWAGEASPSYLYSAAAAAAISQFATDPRIIITVRNPIDLMYSLYSLTSMAAFYNGDPPLPDFEALLRADALEPRDAETYHGPRARLSYHDLAHLAVHIERYIGIFGRERVHLVVFDDLKARTAETHRRMSEFLGIDPGAAPLDAVPENLRMPSRRWRSHVLERWLRRPSPRVRAAARAVVPPMVRRAVRGALKALNVTRPRSLNHAVRRRLATLYESEILRLGDLINRDLSHWCAK